MPALTKALESDPRFAGLKDAALKIYESPDHLADPELKDGTIYNTWQDAEHVHGILRRTSVSDYLKPDPHWQTVIDYDAFAKEDKQEWVANGSKLPLPGQWTLPGIAFAPEERMPKPCVNSTSKQASLSQNGFVLAALQTGCQSGLTRTLSWWPATGRRHHDQIRLSLCA